MKRSCFHFGVGVGVGVLALALYLGSSMAAEPVAGILEQHNVYRCMHNADAVTYSSTLEADALEYADELAAACGDLVHDTLDGVGENLASCAGFPVASDACSSGIDATPRWYDELAFYIDDPSVGYTTDSTEATGHFTQVVWKSTTEIGCASASCEGLFDGSDLIWHKVYVVCRYSGPGNFAGQYTDNVEGGAPSTSFDECTVEVGGNGDPHMSGFKGQKFDFTGKEDTWYALLHDRKTVINMRITAPVPDVPEITYITGLGLSIVGTDSVMHTVEIVINNPHDLNPTCDESNPCLADGALIVLVDGEHEGVGQMELGGGVSVSALNIPGECRPFGFEKYWLEKEEAASRRKLRGAFSPGMWLTKDTKRTDPEACDKYIAQASAARTLFDHQSEHASFQITSPNLSLRVNIGKVHQLAMRDPTDEFDLPDHVAYQINVGFEAFDVDEKAQGILGETMIPTVNEEGSPIMEGRDCIRGQEEDYAVSDPLSTNFSLNV